MGGHSGSRLGSYWAGDVEGSVFVFEVHRVPSLGPISHRISAPAMAHAGKGSKSVLGVCLRGLSLPRGVVRS